MKSTAQKLIVISFILAVIASITVFLYLQSLKSPKELSKNITVLVAAETIPPRTLIDKKMVKEIQVPNNSYFSDYIKDSSKIIGKYTKETISQNEGFQENKLLVEDGNELSLKIDSNHRAISISATGDSGVSDLLKPGDFVDVIAYLAEKRDGQKIVRADMAKMVLQNIQILAVDKQLDRNEKNNDKTNTQDKAVSVFLVTLSVPTSDIEKLVLSESIGTLKLALRPLKDDTTTDTSGTTWEQLTVNTSSENADVTNEKNNGSIGDEQSASYTIKEGDTLKKISKAFYGDENKYQIIQEANNIQNENYILIGEIIKIPALK